MTKNQKKKDKRERFIKIELLNITSEELIELVNEKLENKLISKMRVYENELKVKSKIY